MPLQGITRGVWTFMYSVSHTYNKKHVFQAHLMESILTPTCVFVTLCLVYQNTVVFACLHSKQLNKVSLLSWSHNPHCKFKLPMHVYVWAVASDKINQFLFATINNFHKHKYIIVNFCHIIKNFTVSVYGSTSSDAHSTHIALWLTDLQLPHFL